MKLFILWRAVKFSSREICSPRFMRYWNGAWHKWINKVKHFITNIAVHVLYDMSCRFLHVLRSHQLAGIQELWEMRLTGSMNFFVCFILNLYCIYKGRLNILQPCASWDYFWYSCSCLLPKSHILSVLFDWISQINLNLPVIKFDAVPHQN